MTLLSSRLLPDDASSDHRPFAWTALLPPHKPRILTALRWPYRRRIRGVHSSGRYDRTMRSLLLAILSYLAGHNIVTTTEVADPERRKALQRRGWTTCQVDGPDGRAECAALLAKWVWTDVRFTTVLLSSIEIPARGQHCRALLVTARHRRTKQQLKMMVAHLPARIEDDLRDGRLTTSTACYMECVNTMALAAERWAADPAVDAAGIVCDWNISYREPWVQRYIARKFPAYACNWEGHMPPKGDGTHEGRLIDFALVSA